MHEKVKMKYEATNQALNYLFHRLFILMPSCLCVFLFLQWIDCDLRRGEASSNNQALMGYALRTMDFKYIAYFRFNRTGWQLDLSTEPHFQVLPNCGDLNLIK